MSRIVAGIGASHTTLMNTKWDEVDHLERAHRYRDGLAAARRLLTDAALDLVLVVGSNHFRGFWLDLMPTFTLGVGEVIGAGEHGTPAGRQPSRPDVALGLASALVERHFDVAFSAELQVDHGITHAIQYVVPEGTPVLPVIVNCFAPPLPTLDRCAELGTAIADLVEQDGRDLRVGVVGSGGLSHQLPFPDWRTPQSDDDEFLVDSWLHGRGRWDEFETRRRGIVTSAPPRLAEDFDADVLARVEAGSLAELCDRPDATAAGGNGAEELRNWIVMAAACRWAAGRTIAYSAMPEWLTGMAVVALDPTESSPDPKGPTP